MIDSGRGLCYNANMVLGWNLSEVKDARQADEAFRRLWGGKNPVYLLSDKGRMMKSFSLCKVVLAVILGVFILLPVGCNTAQLGETEAESARRHRRVHRINQSELMADIDRVFLLDQPSRLTDKRIP